MAGKRVVEERDASESVAATYVYGSYIDDVVSMRRGGADYYFLHDDQWNVVALTNASGLVLERVRYGESGRPAFVRASCMRKLARGRNCTRRQLSEEKASECDLIQGE